MLNCAPNPQDSFQLSTCKPSSSGYLLRDICGTQYHFKPPCLPSWGSCWHIIVHNVNRWELIVGWWPCLYDHSGCHRHWKVLCSGSSSWKQRKTNKSQTQGLWYSSISLIFFPRTTERVTWPDFSRVCRLPAAVSMRGEYFSRLEKTRKLEYFKRNCTDYFFILVYFGS